MLGRAHEVPICPDRGLDNTAELRSALTSASLTTLLSHLILVLSRSLYVHISCQGKFALKRNKEIPRKTAFLTDPCIPEASEDGTYPEWATETEVPLWPSWTGHATGSIISSSLKSEWRLFGEH